MCSFWVAYDTIAWSFKKVSEAIIDEYMAEGFSYPQQHLGGSRFPTASESLYLLLSHSDYEIVLKGKLAFIRGGHLFQTFWYM